MEVNNQGKRDLVNNLFLFFFLLAFGLASVAQRAWGAEESTLSGEGDVMCKFKYELHNGDTLAVGEDFSGGVSPSPLISNHIKKVHFVKSVTTINGKLAKDGLVTDVVEVGSSLRVTVEGISVSRKKVSAKVDFNYATLDQIEKAPAPDAPGMDIEIPTISNFQFSESVVLKAGEKYKKVFGSEKPMTLTLWVDGCR